MEKSRAQRIHFKRRLLQRAGIEINRDGIQAIVRSIQRGEAKFVKKQTNRTTQWEVVLDGKPLLVIYDKNRHTLVTVLTPK